MSFIISEAQAEPTSTAPTPSGGSASATAPAASANTASTSTALSSTAPASTGSTANTTSTTVATTSTPASAPGKQAITTQVILLVGLILLMYFLIWRPQAKRTKEHKEMMGHLHPGSEVVFAGGLLGRVKKIEGDYVVIATSPASEVKVQKNAIQAVLPEGTLNSI